MKGLQNRESSEGKNSSGMISLIIGMLILLALICPVALSARDFTYQGIIYTVLDEEFHTCATSGYCRHGETGELNYRIINIPGHVCDNDNIAFEVTKIGECTFKDYQDLIAITLPDTVDEIKESAFDGCISLNSVTLSCNLKTIHENAFHDCINLHSIDFPFGLQNIKYGAFDGCVNMERFDIPDSVESYSLWFSHYPNLKYVRLPYGVKYLWGGYFYNCASLEEVEIPLSVTFIGDSDNFEQVRTPGVFEGCANLRRVNLPEQMTSIGRDAFCDCTGLETIVLPKDLEDLRADVFWGCTSLKEIIYPTSEPQEMSRDVGSTHHPTKGADYGFTDFHYETATLKVGTGGAKKAQTIAPWKYFRRIREIEDVVPERIEFEHDGLMYGVVDEEMRTCTVVRAVCEEDGAWNEHGMPDGLAIPAKASDGDLEYAVVEIGSYAFEGEKGLESVRIADGVGTIGKFAFSDCADLEYVALPAEVSLEDGSFSGCDNIREIWYPTDSPVEADESVFSGGTYAGAVLYVARGGLEVARRTAPWRYFNHIREVESPHADIKEWLGGAEVQTDIYTLGGIRVAAGNSSSLPRGTYVLRRGCMTAKIHIP